MTDDSGRAAGGGGNSKGEQLDNEAALRPLHDQLGTGAADSNLNVGASTSAQHDKTSFDAKSREEGDAKSSELNVVAAYKAHFREDPVAWFQQVWAYGQGSGWRGYTDYIGAQILYPGQSEAVIREILTSEQVRARIQQLAERRVETLAATLPPSGSDAESRTKIEKLKAKKRRQFEAQLGDVARSMAEVSVARLDSQRFIKVFAATINNVLVRMYHQGIHISVPQILELRRVAAFCAERKYSILFLPCHKSHIDYLTFSWLIFRLGLSLPHIIAGENLDLPVVGNILRGGGAFFIRRTFSGDELYPVVIKEYIEQLISKGKNLECFIEGTRSRTGKLLPPKLGILKYIVDGLLAQRTEDVYVCPVSIQYDDVVEAETFVSELLGKPKEAESLFGLLSGSSSLLSLQMGRIDVRFKTPWSLRGFIDEQVKRREAPGPEGTRTALDLKNNSHHKLLLLRTLGYRVLADINQVGVVMPAALVGTIMLTLRGRGIARTDLIRRVDWLRNVILARGYQVADFGQLSTAEVVDRALNVMKDQVEVQTDVMEPTLIPLKRFELSFYRNQIMHIFVSESLLCVSLYTLIKQGGGSSNVQMDRNLLQKETGFISHIFRNEFVFGTDTLEANVDRTVRAMCNDHILAEYDGERRIGLSQKQRESGRREFDTYLFLIWPYIEGYWLAASSLLLLAVPPKTGSSADGKTHWYAAKEFEKRAQLFGKTLYAQGELSYLEAVSAQTLSQAMTRFEELGFVQRRKSRSAKPIPLIAVVPEAAPQYDESKQSFVAQGKLWDFLERLNTFRREGKDRRDAADVIGEAVQRIIRANAPNVVETTGGETTAHM